MHPSNADVRKTTQLVIVFTAGACCSNGFFGAVSETPYTAPMRATAKMTCVTAHYQLNRHGLTIRPKNVKYNVSPR
jgi:hypothetical protein